MAKPSIFSGEYQRIMKRRRRFFRIAAVLAALCIIFLVYHKPNLPNLKSIVENIKLPDVTNTENNKKNDEKKQNNAIEDKKSSDEEKENKEQGNGSKDSGEFKYSFSNGEDIYITYKKDGNDIKLTGIRPEREDISYDIREDGKSIVFDNPKISDIWVFNIDGTSRKISPDAYKQSGENGGVFTKKWVMEQYRNNYVWAAKPKYLKDGRIVYQSNLPWFREKNNYYIWVVNEDGGNNRLVTGTDSDHPAEYYSVSDNNIIVVINGVKYDVNVDKRSKQALN